MIKTYLFSSHHLYTHSGGTKVKHSYLDYAKLTESLGSGVILLNSF